MIPLPPNDDPFPEADDDSIFPGNECVVVTYTEEFWFESASTYLAVNGDPSNVGSQYIFNTPARNVSDSQELGLLVSGLCTRTSVEGILGSSGAGTCNFDFVDSENNTMTATAQGYLDTVSETMTAGTLAATGGTGALYGLQGQMTIIPLSSLGAFDDSDVFTEVYAYYVISDFTQTICPEVPEMEMAEEDSERVQTGP
jgi:hypothetical protein